MGIAYIISDVSHPNPCQSVLAAHAMRVVSRSSEDEPSTSVEEQCVTAAMSKLNRIAPDNCEALLSLDSLSGLMALKKVCTYCDMTARHGVRTKEAVELGIATLHIQQMCARGVYFGMMHEAACHNREKNGTTNFSQTARLSLPAKTMVATCRLETLPSTCDLTNLIFTMAYDHRNGLQSSTNKGETWMTRILLRK